MQPHRKKAEERSAAQLFWAPRRAPQSRMRYKFSTHSIANDAGKARERRKERGTARQTDEGEGRRGQPAKQLLPGRRRLIELTSTHLEREREREKRKASSLSVICASATRRSLCACFVPFLSREERKRERAKRELCEGSSSSETRRRTGPLATPVP